VQQLDLLGRADHDGLDAAIAAVPHPALEAEDFGLPAHRVSEPDPLDTALDQQVQRRDHTTPAERRRAM
jgi:hypothetical protein